MADFAKTIYLGEPSGTVRHKFKEMLPGRVAILMDSAETRNGIYMPGSGRLTPDSGVVLASGAEELTEGQRALTRAYNGDQLTGKWMEIDGRTVKLYGVADNWFEDVVATFDDNKIVPTYDWVYIMRHFADDGGIIRSDRRTDKWKQTASVVRTGWSARELTWRQKIAYKGDALDFKFGNISEEMGLIRLSQVLAVVE